MCNKCLHYCNYKSPTTTFRHAPKQNVRLLVKPPHLPPHTHTPAFINTLSPSDMGVCGQGSGSLGKETRVVDLVMAGGKEKGQRKLLGTKPSPKR